VFPKKFKVEQGAQGQLGTPGLEGRTRGRTLITGCFSETSPNFCRRGSLAGRWRAPLMWRDSESPAAFPEPLPGTPVWHGWIAYISQNRAATKR